MSDQQYAEILKLRALNAELVTALEECADDLASWVEHYYKGTKDYPSQMRRYVRDMEPLEKARAVLAKAKEQRGD